MLFHGIPSVHEVYFPILTGNSGTQMFQNTNILKSFMSASVILHQAMVSCRCSIGGVHEHIYSSLESVDAVKLDVSVESLSNHFLWTCSNAESGICVNFLLNADQVVETGGIASLVALAVINGFFHSAAVIQLYIGIHIDEIWMTSVVESLGVDGNVMLSEMVDLRLGKLMM